MPSFDIVSEVELQEVDNALNQAKKEVVARYDFKGSKTEITYSKGGDITILTEDDMKLRAVSQIITQKMTKRGISAKSLDFTPAEPASGDMKRQVVKIKQGIPTEKAKQLSKMVKELKLKKVQAQIQGEQVRITGPKRDDLQKVISHMEENVKDLDLQFINFRD